MKILKDEQIKDAMIEAIDQGQEYTITEGEPTPFPERAVAQTQLEQDRKDILEEFDKVFRSPVPQSISRRKLYIFLSALISDIEL